MSATNMSAADTTAVIYPAQSVLTLISRAWNLLRNNLKTSVLIMLPPTLVVTVIHMLFSILSSRTVLTPTSFPALSYQLIITLMGLLLLIPYGYLWTFSICALSRFYYSAIVGDKPLTARECWAYVGKHWLGLGGLATGLGLVSAVLVVTNLLLLGLGVFLSSLLITTLVASMSHLGNALIPSIMVLMFLLIWGFTILALAISMVTFQMFFFLFPMLSIATSSSSRPFLWLPLIQKTSYSLMLENLVRLLLSIITSPSQHFLWLPMIQKSYSLLFGNFVRLLLFAVALFFLYLAMIAVMMGPASIWAMVELAREGMSHHDRLPLHIQMIINIWSSIANLILGPFQISAATLLWYDCQVRKEGLDLRLWFNQLVRRHGHQPTEYHTETEPQAN